MINFALLLCFNKYDCSYFCIKNFLKYDNVCYFRITNLLFRNLWSLKIEGNSRYNIKHSIMVIGQNILHVLLRKKQDQICIRVNESRLTSGSINPPWAAAYKTNRKYHFKSSLPVCILTCGTTYVFNILLFFLVCV